MKVNSRAFKKKCQFLVAPKYEIFLALAYVAVQPKELGLLSHWRVNIEKLIGSQEDHLRGFLAFSAAVAALFPADQPHWGSERLLKYLESMDSEVFAFQFLKGLLHDEEVCRQILD